MPCSRLVFLSLDCALSVDYAPKPEITQVLSGYLSGLTLTDGDPFELRLPEKEIPEGFHLIHKRSSKRAMYTINPEFAIILSNESSWRSDIATEEESRKSVVIEINRYNLSICSATCKSGINHQPVVKSKL